MKIEDEKDCRAAEVLVLGFKKSLLSNFTGAEAYLLIESLRRLAQAIDDFKKGPPSPVVPVAPADSKISRLSDRKKK